MENNSKILDDLTRVAGGAFTILSALGKQIQSNVKDQMGDKMGNAMPSKFSFATPANDDVERLQGMVSKMRIEQEDLKKRIEYLENLLGAKAKTKVKTKAKGAVKPISSKTKKKSAKK